MAERPPRSSREKARGAALRSESFFIRRAAQPRARPQPLAARRDHPRLHPRLREIRRASSTFRSGPSPRASGCEVCVETVTPYTGADRHRGRQQVPAQRGAGLNLGAISAPPRLNLGSISAAPSMYLGRTSAVPRLYLGCTSAVPRPPLGHLSAIFRPPLGHLSPSLGCLSAASRLFRRTAPSSRVRCSRDVPRSQNTHLWYSDQR